MAQIKYSPHVSYCSNCCPFSHRFYNTETVFFVSAFVLRYSPEEMSGFLVYGALSPIPSLDDSYSHAVLNLLEYSYSCPIPTGLHGEKNLAESNKMCGLLVAEWLVREYWTHCGSDLQRWSAGLPSTRGLVLVQIENRSRGHSFWHQSMRVRDRASSCCSVYSTVAVLRPQQLCSGRHAPSPKLPSSLATEMVPHVANATAGYRNLPGLELGMTARNYQSCTCKTKFAKPKA